MKTIIFKICGLIGLGLIASCSDILEEQPRSNMTPDFFETKLGIEGGLTAAYSHLRWFYGPISRLYEGTNGTDECTWAVNQDGGGRAIDEYNINSTQFPAVWNNAFPNINTCNGIIEKGAAAGVDAALIAEAKFFRAHDYFLLVQTYGAAPLDLGSGKLAFNTTPVRVSVRDSEQEVYAAIFQDLNEAVSELPTAGRVTGGATKTAARFFLAKAYLTYGWWLERSSKSDPAGKSPAQYYQLAYDKALEAINNPDGFGLMETFYDVNLAANDRNKEIILYADHTSSSAQFNEGGLTNNDDTRSGGMKENRSNYAICCNFEQPTGGVPDNVVRRIAQQDLGRPWVRIMPTANALLETFADKTHDSRYDGTFVTTYYANFNLEEPDVASKQGANSIQIFPGDVAWRFLPDDTEQANLVREGDGHNLPGHAYAVWTPSTMNRSRYPGAWKLGPDNPNKTRSGPWNAPSTRPFPIAKFSELYLIAAEAAVKGATGSMTATELVNVIRERAGKWRWDNNGRQAKNEDHSADMAAATPSPVTLDFILAERSRELFAEGGRWLDLTRTGKLEEYAGSYEVCNNDETAATTKTRTIQPYHYLRPIPQSQIDALEMTDAEKAAYQNPGY
jgi:hypothetical protein